MSEYTYSVTKDVTKLVPLYHHEQVPFHSMARQQKQELSHSEDSWRHSSQNSQQSSPTNSSPASYDLQDVILYYQSQPELLRLILLSKLEEDKRRAEEAKMRAKELDLILLQQQHQITANAATTASTASQTESFPASNHVLAPPSHFHSPLQISPTPPSSSAGSSDGRNNGGLPQQPLMRHTHLDTMLSSPHATLPRRDSNLASIGGSANSDELEERTFSPLPSNGTHTPLLSLSSYAPSMLPFKQHPLSPPTYIEDYSFPTNLQQIQMDTNTNPSSLNQNFQQPQPSQQNRYDPYVPQRPRRRREMQAITKIVETRDHPYIDGYFWKNNGNTVQKKTGNRSVYYKCSNSSKGCPVNKTVTWKDNGEYLIKYRGDHLLDCGKVQRIVDM
ncbi:hypothetical protein BDF14DRAFT_1853611 [Spinellus fusiger]|nr:hypothetical protein BDF14DRAFT_1853611 [Spinellus fusiger]